MFQDNKYGKIPYYSVFWPAPCMIDRVRARRPHRDTTEGTRELFFVVFVVRAPRLTVFAWCGSFFSNWPASDARRAKHIEVNTAAYAVPTPPPNGPSCTGNSEFGLRVLLTVTQYHYNSHTTTERPVTHPRTNALLLPACTLSARDRNARTKANPAR